MSGHVCPSWCSFSLANPFRRLLHHPERILAPYVHAGAVVADIGCGPGFFTLAMARLVGADGHVIAVDLQEKMLRQVRRGAEKAGLLERISLRLSQAEKIGITEKVDFAMTFWMVHEVRDAALFFRQIRQCLKKSSRYLLCEPKLHVGAAAFAETVATAQRCGLVPVSTPVIALSRSLLFGI